MFVYLSKYPDLGHSLVRIFVNILQIIKTHSLVYIYIGIYILNRKYMQDMFCIIGPRVFKNGLYK